MIKVENDNCNITEKDSGYIGDYENASDSRLVTSPIKTAQKRPSSGFGEDEFTSTELQAEDSETPQYQHPFLEPEFREILKRRAPHTLEEWQTSTIQALYIDNLKLKKENHQLRKEIQENEARNKQALADSKKKDMNMMILMWNTLRTKHKLDIENLENSRPAMDLDVVKRFQDEVASLKKTCNSLRMLPEQMKDSMESMVQDTVKQLQMALLATEENNKDLQKKYCKEMKLRKAYHNQLVELRGNIRVFCRVRPFIREDGDVGDSSPVTSFDPVDDGIINIANKSRQQEFKLDKVFSPDITQQQVFNEVSDLIHSVLDGFNVCIFAYGQTGSGKTYTMEGSPDDPGVNQRALTFLMEQTMASAWHYDIKASVMEVYNEQIHDLLNPDPANNKVEVKMRPEGGLHVPGLCSVPVHTLEEVNVIFEKGRQNRATAATNMNEHSSRSHCLLRVTVTGLNNVTGDKTFGTLNLVDLAGSERVGKSQVDGARLKEAQNINRSLSSLGDVINSLRNKHTHVPYRNSKLTYLLQESLGGDSKTLMILQASPAEKNVSETVCTLTFGQRVRSTELGAASRKLEEGGKNTPSSLLRAATDHSGTPTSSHVKNSTPRSAQGEGKRQNRTPLSAQGGGKRQKMF